MSFHDLCKAAHEAIARAKIPRKDATTPARLAAEAVTRAWLKAQELFRCDTETVRHWEKLARRWTKEWLKRERRAKSTSTRARQWHAELRAQLKAALKGRAAMGDRLNHRWEKVPGIREDLERCKRCRTNSRLNGTVRVYEMAASPGKWTHVRPDCFSPALAS